MIHLILLERHRLQATLARGVVVEFDMDRFKRNKKKKKWKSTLIILKLKTVDYHEINAAYFVIPEKHKTSPTQIKWEYTFVFEIGVPSNLLY